MLKFYWNGIKEDGGNLQKCSYSMSQLINFQSGTITIYARTYSDFSAGVRKSLNVENNSDHQTDYVVSDHIRVEPTHRLYKAVFAAYSHAVAHNARMAGKSAA